MIKRSVVLTIILPEEAPDSIATVIKLKVVPAKDLVSLGEIQRKVTK